MAINEVTDISPSIGRRLARWAAALRYGRTERGSIRSEEWCALLTERPGKLLKLITGLWLFLDALPRAAWRLIGRSPASEPSLVVPPHHPLTPRQTAALLTLMAAGRAGISNRELFELYGVTISGADRALLNNLGLVSTCKVGRNFVHDLSDTGWAWCAEEIRTNRARMTGRSGDAALVALSAGINRYIERNGLSLADVFSEHGGTRVPVSRRSARRRRRSTTTPSG